MQNAGDYQVVISGVNGFTNSATASLNISPTITSPFIGATPVWGENSSFSVGVIGTGTLNYQWLFNGIPIPGANDPNLNFPSIQFSNSGLYSVVITSPYGSATNTPAQVVVNTSLISFGFSPTLTIKGTVGYSYIIQRSSDLTNTNSWQTVTSLTLYAPVEIWADTGIDSSSPFNKRYFYRILPAQ